MDGEPSSILQIPGESTLKRNFQLIQQREGRPQANVQPHPQNQMVNNHHGHQRHHHPQPQGHPHGQDRPHGHNRDQRPASSHQAWPVSSHFQAQPVPQMSKQPAKQSQIVIQDKRPSSSGGHRPHLPVDQRNQMYRLIFFCFQLGQRKNMCVSGYPTYPDQNLLTLNFFSKK